MALEKTLTSGRRFGARYGRRVRHKFSKIEAEQKKSHQCPYCNDMKVGRVSAGIWKCRKCDAKFTGRAYTVPKKVVITSEAAKEEEMIEEMEEAEEKETEEEKEKPVKYKEKQKEEQKEDYVQESLEEAKE